MPISRLIVMLTTLLLAGMLQPAAAQFGGGSDNPFAQPPGVADGTSAATGETARFGDSRDRVEVSLRAAYEQVPRGHRQPVMLIFDHDPGWHIWTNQGNDPPGVDVFEGAIRTEATLTATAGVEILDDQIRWPLPHEAMLNLMGAAQPFAVFEGRAVMSVPVVIADDAPLGPATITATVTFQSCDATVCDMPVFDHEVTATFEIVDADLPTPAALPEHFADFDDNSFEGVAPSLPGDAAPKADVIKPVKDSAFSARKLHWWIALLFVVFAMGWMAARTLAFSRRRWVKGLVTIVAVAVVAFSFLFVRGVTAKFPWVPYSEAAFNQSIEAQKITFLKFTADWCANCQVNERIILASDEARAILTSDEVTSLKVDFTGPHPQGQAILNALGAGGIPLMAVYRPGEEPITIRGQIGSAQVVIDALHGEHAAAIEGEMIFDFLNWRFSVRKDATLLILVLAFIAGFLMNFTPCVLPVIPLKILSLQAHAKNPARCFLLGIIFGLGIIALYAVLGVLIAGLIGGVEKMDWGQQFQNWWFNGAIALIVGVMGLGMIGMFTIRLPQWAYMFSPQSDSTSGSFFMGVFTAVLSTPCTGPLLGATIAWVATQTAGIAFLTLLIMGVGMAFPYVLLTARPQWLNRLPKAGPGSELVKQVMGIMLMAVAVYFGGVAINALNRPAPETADNTTIPVQYEIPGESG